MPDPKARPLTHAPERGTRRIEAATHHVWKQASRARWRSSVLTVKAKLEAATSGITAFETGFRGNIVMPGASCAVGEFAKEDRRLAHDVGPMVPLLPPPEGQG